MTGLGGGADAFDALASRYDALFSPAANPLVALARARVHAALGRHFAPGAALLEVGCGTGEDTLALTARGHTLVACDPAPQM
ncbi:MAG TPA: class I SAM-dependent methyltransferase, partial [Polyangia bacterium]|nr:class I SAM-dependent methyltransferase [Polyangia bacterium]